MRYTLFNKHVPVCDLYFDEQGRCRRCYNIQNPEYAPVGVQIGKYRQNGMFFSEWWGNRLIPETRKNLASALAKTGLSSVGNLALHSLGASLSDQYWLCPEGENLRWEDVNFFTNDFANDIGPILCESTSELKGPGPNASSNGNLPKEWIISDGKRILLKGGSDPFQQEPLNEFLASAILEQLSLPHVDYSLSDNAEWSTCECFVTPQTEFVPLWNILFLSQKRNNENTFSQCSRILDTLAIDNWQKYIQDMLLFDYCIANTDRHFNNFGLIRNVETLQFEGFAPLFDHGASLWYDKPDKRIGCACSCKPYYDKEDKQLALISDFSLLENTISLEAIFSQPVSENISQERLENIAKSVQTRIDYAISLAEQNTFTQAPC